MYPSSQKVIEYLILMEKGEFLASRDIVTVELLTIETITNMCYNGKEGDCFLLSIPL